MSIESIRERNRRRAAENDQKMGATALGTSALNYSTEQKRSAAQQSSTPASAPAQSVHAGAERAGLSRDQYDSAVRGRYAQRDQSVLERIGNALSGAGKQYVGQQSAALSTLYGLGQKGRDAQNEAFRAEQQDRYDRAKREYAAMLQDNEIRPGSWSQGDLESSLNIMEDARRKADAMGLVIDEQIQQKAAKAAQDYSRDVVAAGAEDVDLAKQGLNAAGQFAVDLGVAGSQMLMDAAFGGGSGTIPMASRVFGGGYQEAVDAGASGGQALAYGVGSALTSVATERLASIAAPFKKIYGAGVLDDVLKKVTGKMGESAVGRLALAAVSEAGEEWVEAMVQPVLQRATYDPDAAFDVEEALYSALVGGALGGIGGGVELVGNRASGRRTAPQAEPVEEPVQQQEAAEAPAPQEAGEDILMRAAAQVAQNGSVTGKMADRILADEAAMAQLGIDTNGMTKSQSRQAVKDIMAQRSVAQAGISVQGATADAAAPSVRSEATQERVARDIQQVRSAAAALGENGAKALTAAYDADTAKMVDAPTAFSVFSKVYHAKMNGTQMKADDQKLVQSVPQSLVLAAQAGAEQDLQRAKQAAYFGKNSMLVRDDNFKRANLSTRTASVLDAAAKAAGVQVRFAPQVKNGEANASYENGVITIALDSKDPVMTAFTHEIVHRIRETSPQSYASLAAFVQNHISQATNTALVNQYSRLYETGNMSDITEEMVADAFGTILQDGKALEQFVRDNRTAAQKVLDAVRDLINAIKRALSGQNVKLIREQEAAFRELQGQLAGMETALAEALGAIPEGNEKAAQNGGSKKYDIKPRSGVLKALNQIRDRDVDFEMDSISIGTIPKIYTDLFDISELDLTVNMRHAYNSMASAKEAKKENMYRVGHRDDYHAMGVDGYARAIESVKTPLAIMDADKGGQRKNLRIAMVLRADGIEEPLFGVIELYSTKRIDGGAPQKTHALLSIYDKDSAPDYAKTAAENNRVLYVDKEQDLTGTPALQLRSSLSDSALKKNLAQFNRKVNAFKVENKIDDAKLLENRVESGRYEENARGSEDAAMTEVNVSYDTETESVSPAKFSLKTWNESTYVTSRDKAAKSMAEALGISKRKAAAYIDMVNGVAKTIADDRVRLDYEASPDRSAFVGNSEYGGSIDFSTICKKRRLLTGTFEAIQNALPNTALTAEEVLEIRRMMAEKGYEVSCGLCYVEGSRANMGQYARQFLDEYAKTDPEYLPNMAEMNTATGQEMIRREHPEVYAAYEKFMNGLAQRKPKMYQMATEYQGEVLTKFGRKNVSVEEKNRNGGLRMQSFSDFEIIHLIDSMQVIMDMAQVGLAGQAYTKVPDFAWALGDTGLKINLSLIAKGIDGDGNLVLDEVEGMARKDAEALRSRYSDNVGTIIVVFTDEQLKAAMKDPFIDFIIPFHRSQWNSQQYAAMGLPANAKDYTSVQNESYIEPVYNKNGKKQRPSNYMPNTYWDYSRTGTENARTYLAMCAANNRKPKFSHLLVNNGDGSYSLQPDGSTDGYWKTLIDFKMYDNDGIGKPQVPVRPDFNMEEATRMLEEYAGGHQSFPVAQDIVDTFVSRYKADHPGADYSLKSKNSDWAESAAAARKAVSDAQLAGMMSQGKKDAAAARKQREATQKALDREKAKREAAVGREREKRGEAVKAERAKREAAVDTLKKRQREKEAKARESRNAAALRGKIQRHVADLSRKLRNPTDKKHIPEALRGPVAMLLENINMESKYEYVFGKDGKYHRASAGSELGAELAMRTKAFADLKKAYAEIKGAGEIVIDPDLLGGEETAGLLDEVVSYGEIPIASMNSEQLQTVWKTIRAVEASIRNANRMLAESRFATVRDAAFAVRNDNLNKRSKTEWNYIGKLQKLVSVDMLTPEAYFRRLGSAGEAIFRMLRNAQDQHIRLMKQVADFTEETLKGVSVRELEQEMHTVTLGGQEVELSIAQIMELHALMNREQARDHILKGGVLPDVVSKKGLKKAALAEPIHGVTQEELADVISLLTEDQVQVAQLLQAYASTEMSDWGNKASMDVYGYEKFNEKNYWPIRSNRQEVRSDVQKDTQVTTVANRGFTRPVKPHANNSVMVGSIFDTFSSHASDMATYAAWLGTSEDVNRIQNFVFRDGEGNTTGTVKGILDRVHGVNKGQQYLQKLLADIANGVKGTHAESNLFNVFVGNYKAASVGANLRVIVQQPTSILRAFEMIDPKYFVSGANPVKGFETAMNYAPIAQWKDWGYFDIHTGRQMKDVLFNSATKLDKVKEAAMWGAGKMDSVSWGVLWNAVEAEVKDKTKHAPGSEEFYRAAAERFNEIIDRTQVVDGILQRSQIMRNPDGISKMATSFMGEPTKQYNMLLSSIYDARNGKVGGKRAVARTTTALVFALVVNAAVQSVMDAYRDDDKEKDYWEKWLAQFSGAGSEDDTFLDSNLGGSINPLTYIPFVKDLWSVLQGYDVSRMDVDGLDKVASAASNMMKSVRGEGKMTVFGAAINLIGEASRLWGIPLANVKRDILGALNTVAIGTDNHLMQYRIDKLLYSQGGNAANFLDILYNASANDPAAYEIIYADLVREDQLKTETKTTEQRIASGMESRMKKSQGVKSVEDLESRFLTPSQQKDYDDVHSQVVKSSAWKAANEKQRESLEANLYSLTVGNGDSKSLQKKIDGGAAYGIDETDYLLYKLALQVVDQPSENGKLGSYTGEEVQKAIDMVSGLSDHARSYLWTAQGKSEKSNPYK